MTTILGMHLGCVAYLAADGLENVDDLVTNPSIQKITSWGPWRIALAGPGAAIKTLLGRRRAEIEAARSAGTLVAILREEIDRHGWKPSSDPGDLPQWHMSMLIAGPDGLHMVTSTLLAQPVPEGVVENLGSGGSLALAAARACLRRGDPPELALLTGVEIACELDIRSGGEIQEAQVPFVCEVDPLTIPLDYGEASRIIKQASDAEWGD